MPKKQPLKPVIVGICIGFAIGLIASIILGGQYDVFGTVCWSAVLVPLCSFGGGFVGEYIRYKRRVRRS